MAEGLTFIIRNEWQRQRAMETLLKAPLGTIAVFKPEGRTIPQNDRMWAMLGELALAKPDGRTLPAHKWKSLAMDAANCKPDWERSLDGESMVCVGYKSSRLSKALMGDVMMAIEAYAADKGVHLTSELAA